LDETSQRSTMSVRMRMGISRQRYQKNIALRSSPIKHVDFEFRRRWEEEISVLAGDGVDRIHNFRQ
jgi:hypothetical protein